MLAFYQPQAGRVLLDEVDVARSLPEDVRKRIAIVPQETVLFADTIGENIRYGRPGASDEAVVAAARAAVAQYLPSAAFLPGVVCLPPGCESAVVRAGVQEPEADTAGEWNV